MTSQLNSVGKHVSASQLACRFFFATLGLFVSIGISTSVAGQNIQPRPVARLLSEPAATASLARPRRVKLETSTSASVEPSPTTSSLEGATTIERRAFEQTNAARSENGLPLLTWDPELCRLARAHSERMASQGFFSHRTPEGLELKDRARSGGISHFRVIGENIAYNKGYDDPGGFAVERWMISSGHRANILYAGFQSGAIGSYVSADGSVYLTQVFIAR
jgi:uncharacterized protein YkwD